MIYVPTNVQCNVKLYADDVLLYTTVRTEEDCHKLQADLNSLEQWAKKWNIIFNPAKCEFLRVSNKSYNVLMHYCIQGKEVKHATSSKYLGVTIDDHLTWNDHVISKANKVKRFLQHNIKYCPSIVMARCLIRPILEYASAIWSPCTQKNIDLLEAMQ